MLYHEVLEKATAEDIAMFIANRNLDVREQKRRERRQAFKDRVNAKKR